MSGLASVLAGRTPPGLYTWHSGFDVDEVRHTVEHAGWRFAHVDGLRAQTKPELLRAMGEALDFPDWYGQNFDALADCLADVGSTGVGTVLLWDGWAPYARDEARAFSVTLSVLGGRVAADRGGPFAVLLRGEGPDVAGVAALD
jgi:hypothetical protein